MKKPITGQADRKPAPMTNAIVGPQPATRPVDAYSFIELADVITVFDSRGNEQYSDRRFTVDRAVCSGGSRVTGITRAADGWFDVAVGDGRTYRVPVTNVRGARRA